MVNIAVVRLLARLRGLTQSDLARLAGVSRQAVSFWLRPRARGGEVPVRSSHLRRLATGLGVSADRLLEPLPQLDDPAARGSLETALNWDRLFPTLEDLFVASARGDLRALARWVEVRGLFAAAGIAGRKVWSHFPEYARYIRPPRRAQCERIWNLQKNLNLI